MPVASAVGIVIPVAVVVSVATVESGLSNRRSSHVLAFVVLLWKIFASIRHHWLSGTEPVCCA